MERVFGLPIDGLTTGLLVIMAAVGGVIAVLAARHRVFFRLGVRNIWRRPARSVLIVVGLMLGTAIICSALTTGDTMARTIRSMVTESLGATDEVIGVRGSESDTGFAEASAPVSYFPQARVTAVEDAVRGWPLVDGVAPAIIETIAVQDRTSRQNEPRVGLFASDPDGLARLAPMRDARDGSTVTLGQLGPTEVFIDDDAADELHARSGDSLLLLIGRRLVPASVRAVVDMHGAGTAGPAVIMPLDRAQAALGRPGQISNVLVSNRGGEESGAGLTAQVTARLDPVLAPLGLVADPTKADGLEAADAQGNAFMTMFTTFGSFSMAAGILLIFLVFVMLAAERRAEMGMARAVGTQRRHLVETFLFEGSAYDLAAAAVGALLGAAVAYAMVAALTSAFAGSGLDIQFGVRPRSLLVGYGIGVLLTLVVVTASAWRVSRLNIVSAIRDLPEGERVRHRRRWIRGTAGVVIGAFIAYGGYTAGQATPFNLGVSIVIAGLVPLATTLGASPRMAYTTAGLVMVGWWLLPFDEIAAIGDLQADMSIWIVGGLAIVIGATWAVMYNADVLLGAGMRLFGRVRSLAPVLKMAMAYPLRSRFRTAVTLSMFTLVVFTMVTGSIIPGSYTEAMNDARSFGGGFDVRAATFGAGAGADLEQALAGRADADDFTVVASQSVVAMQLRQDGPDGSDTFTDYAVRGLDDEYTTHTTYGFAAMARGYGSAEEVWDAVARQPGLAVVDSMVVPHGQMTFGAMPEFTLRGVDLSSTVFDPIPVTVRDPQTGTDIKVTVVGVLSDAAAYEMTMGLSVSQQTLASLGDRARPAIHYLSVAPGVDAEQAATRLEASFLAEGMQAESMEKILDTAVGGSRTIIRLVQGFMALGLLVGVAALGVISARSVVERRQQIGVLRAIGFQPEMIRRTLMLESSFIALSAVAIGTALGLVMSYNVIADAREQPSWEHIALAVPWVNLVVIFSVVYLAALATTFLPAIRASRLYPAEALRYQ